jgi:glycosyltransferase involved in cell wall biosynthesis
MPAIKLKLLFLTHYFPPEVGAPQSRIDEIAKVLAKRGHKVSVLTNFPHYPDGVIKTPYQRAVLLKESRGEVDVIRSYVWARPNKGFASRMANHLSFCITSLVAASKLPPCDVVVTESPPLFLGFSGWIISRMLGASHIFNVADVWPQSAVEMGALTNRTAVTMAEWLERFIYDHSHLITVVTEGIRKDLLARGLATEKVATLTNGVDLDFFQSQGKGLSVKNELNLSGKFIALYAGTHGMAQGLHVVLRAAGILANEPNIVFVMAGDGAEKAGLVETAQKMNLKNVRFLNTWPKSRMPELLEAADVCLVTLRKLPVFRRALPSKMYEAMAMARPLVVSAEGMAAELVDSTNCGMAIPPENPEKLAEAVKDLFRNPSKRAKMGLRGRNLVEREYSREKIAGKWERLLAETAERIDLQSLYGQ